MTTRAGAGGMISSLNKRLLAIRRLKNHLNPKSLLKIIDGLFTSKLKYGIQLLGKVRRSESDPLISDIGTIQKVQNKLLRMMTGAARPVYWIKQT